MDLDPHPSFQPASDLGARVHARRDKADAALATGTHSSRKKAAPRRTARRGALPRPVSLYDEVTARIVAEIEEGRIPWTRPWHAAGFAPGLPKNADTRRAYSGINILILWAEAAQRGFASQGWLTFRQALALGAAVRKGEKGTTIFYAARFTPKGDGGGAEAAATGRNGAEEAERSVPFLKRFTVFNVAQVEGLPERCNVPAAVLPPRETVPVAEALLAASGADIRVGGGEAYYSPPGDYIALPPQQAFFAQIDYYRTALHELGHYAARRIMPHGCAERQISADQPCESSA